MSVASKAHTKLNPLYPPCTTITPTSFLILSFVLDLGIQHCLGHSATFLLAKQDNFMPAPPRHRPSSSYAQRLLTSDDSTFLDTLCMGVSVRDIVLKGHGPWPSLS